MGGTFDPIHIGHLILGEHAWQQLSLDKVIFMPAGNPPHKLKREGRASNKERFEMVRLAVSDNPHFEISDYEMTEEGYSYTYRTLEELLLKHPDYELYFIIGADSLFDFDTWKEPQRIADACTLVVATRNHTPNEKLDQAIARVRDTYHADVIKLNTENIDVSSQILREQIREKITVRYYVPDAVLNYIKMNHIYEHIPEP